MKKNIASILFSMALLTMVACGNKNNNVNEDTKDSKEVAEEQNDQKFDDSKIEDDTEFAVKAAEDGMLEVQLGQLAVANATSAQVKQFAQSMVTDHSKANEELKSAAQQKNITLPTALSEKSQKKYNDIAEEKGADFDKAYIDYMVSDHKDAVDLFQKEADKGNDADLKAWASGKVPTLQHHLDMAQSTQDAVKNNKKNK
jgi:putative membrane protein